MEISNITLVDYPKIYSLWISNNVDSEFARDYDCYERLISHNNKLCFVLREGDRIVGTLLAGYDGYRINLYHIFVNKDDRRLGYGTKLIKHLEAISQDLKCSSINVTCYATNNDFIKFINRMMYLSRDDFKLFIKK